MIMEAIDRRSRIEDPHVPLTAGNILASWFGKEKSTSGEVVTRDAALGVSPVWQAVFAISGDVAKLPLITYEDTGAERRRAKTHPVFNLLRRHSGDTTANIWLMTMVGHALLYGNAYSRIHYKASGEPYWLEFMHSDGVEIKREGQTKWYLVPKNDEYPDRVAVDSSEIFHLPGLVLDALGGCSLIHFARNTIGRAIATERYGDEFFAAGPSPQGFWVNPAEMSPEAANHFLEDVHAQHSRMGSRHKYGVVADGMQWVQMKVSMRDVRLVEACGWNVKDVARFFNCPPSKLGDDVRTSYNSLESEKQGYLDDTLDQWLSRTEFEANDKLFGEADKAVGRHYCEFERAAYIRADTKTTHEVIAIDVQNGIMTREEARRRLNLGPYPGSEIPLYPSNLTRETGADEPEEPAEPPTPPDPGGPTDGEPQGRNRGGRPPALSAQERIDARELYAELGSYQAVADRLSCDWRTVRRAVA